MIYSPIINTTHYNRLPLEYQPYYKGYYTEILDRIQSLLDNGLTHTSKIHILRFELRYPEGTQAPPDNSIIERFLDSLKKHFERHNYSPAYLYVREQKLLQINPHYHVMFTIDANVANYVDTSKLTELWSRALNTPINSKNIHSQSTILHRNDPHTYSQVFHWLSYMAKVYSKGNAPPRIREWNSTRIPKTP